MTRTVLVTGGRGWLGGLIAARLAAERWEVTLLDLVADCDTVVDCDLAMEIPGFRGRDFDLVVHLAGLAHRVPANAEQAGQFFAVNSQGTRNLLEGLASCRRIPSRLVFISTVAVYGAESGESIREDAPCRAEDPYGASKKQAEDAVLTWGCSEDVVVTILRLPLVAGSAPPGNLGAMVNALRKGRYLGIGAGEVRRSMVLADDVARFIPIVSEVGGVYNLTDGHNPSFLELEISLSLAMNRQPPPRVPVWVAALMARAGDALNSAGIRAPFSSGALGKMTSTLTFSDQRAREALGWEPRRVVDHAGEIVG